MKLIGDFVAVPDWLAKSLPTYYPGRSIEGAFNLTTATGRKHSSVITAVSCLGEELPAVTTLEDFRVLAQAESIEEVLVLNRTEPVAASFFSSIQSEDDMTMHERYLAVVPEWIDEHLLARQRVVVYGSDRFDFRPATSGRPDEVLVLAPCWQSHRDVMDNLAALYGAWWGAYCAEHRSPYGAEEYLDRRRPNAVRRINFAMRACDSGCVLEIP